MTGRATSNRVRILWKRVRVAYKVLRYGEFALRPIGHVVTGTTGMFLTSRHTCQKCGRSVTMDEFGESCPAHPQKVKVV